MKKNRTVLYHALAWLLYIGYSFLEEYLDHSNRPWWIYMLHLSYFLCMAIVFYYCYLLVYPRFLRRDRIMLLVVALVAAPFLFTGARYFLEEMLYPTFFGFRNYNGGVTLSYYLSDNLFRAFPMMIISSVVWNLQDSIKKEKESKLLRQEKTQAELAFLKSQVNPHFLYNTLNYIYAQAYPVSETLAEAVLKLSDMMRYMLHESADGRVELQKEVAYLHNFIDIFKLRFEDKFFVDFTIKGEVDGQRVPSLVLIPFVENAFKHGVVSDPMCPVKIELLVSETQLLFEVKNRISNQQKDHSTGIGLTNINRRLELLYPNQHNLTVQNDGEWYTARLELTVEPLPLPTKKADSPIFHSGPVFKKSYQNQ